MRELGWLLEAELVEVVHPAATIVPLHWRVTSGEKTNAMKEVARHVETPVEHPPKM